MIIPFMDILVVRFIIFFIVTLLIYKFAITLLNKYFSSRLPEDIKLKYIKKLSIFGFLLVILLNSKIIFSYLEYTKYISIVHFLITLNIVYLIVETIKTIFIDYILITKQKFTLPTLLIDIIIFLFYLLVIFTLLSTIFNVDITPFIATSAVLSMVLGLAMQDTLSNLFAGLAMQIDSPFKIGDWVQIENYIGQVININWRTTKIMTVNNELISFPNNVLSKTEVINFTTTNIFPYNLNIGLDYSIPPETVRKAVLEVLEEYDEVLKEPEPVVFLTSYDASSINYLVRYFIKDFSKRKSIANTILELLWYKFKRENITIPYPITTVYLGKKEKERQSFSTTEIVKIFKNIDFFNAFTDTDLEYIAQNSKLLFFTKGEILFKQGDKSTDFYIIKSGKAVVKTIKEDGSETVISNLSNGDFVGEKAFLAGESRSATVIFETFSEVIMVNQSTLNEILTKKPNLIDTVIKIIEQRKLEREQKEMQNKYLDTTQSNTDKPQTQIHEIFSSFKKFFNI